MKKMLLLTAGLLLIAVSAFAGANPGTNAYLSWSATTNVTDAAAAGTNNLFVRYTRAAGPMQFAGAEVKIHWSPVGDGAGCWDLIGVTYKTSALTTCTYLNRGGNVPVATIDPGDADIAWANQSSMTTCTAGAIVILTFENDTCGDPSGCIGLDYASILDPTTAVDLCTIAGPVATINGGGGHQCVTAAAPTTWGKIKATFDKN